MRAADSEERPGVEGPGVQVTSPHEAAPFHDTDASRFLRVLRAPGEVVEVRIPRWNKYGNTASGYFDDLNALVAELPRWDGVANIYVTVNAVPASLLARAHNRIEERATTTTSDTDIERRTRLFIDVDSVRASGISATDDELAAAIAVRDAISSYLASLGWAEPLAAMSGNGAYLTYGIDLPNDAASTSLIERLLKALAARFDTPQAHVDTGVFNAARIMGLVGTRKVKGDPLPDRPHRRSHIDSGPDVLGVVRLAQLEAVAGEAVAPPPRGASTGTARPLVEELTARGIDYRVDAPDTRGVTWYQLRRCPFHGDTPDWEACGVGQQLPDGQMAGHCFHERGQGKGWADFKGALGLYPRDSTSRHPTQPDVERDDADGDDADDGGDGQNAKESQASAMVRLARATDAELFHDAKQDSYATVRVGGHHETFALKGNQASAWLRRLYYEETGKPPGSQGAQDALNMLKAISLFDGVEREVHVRLATTADAVYIDLGDADWHTIEVTPQGWRVLAECPVRFRRARGILPLPAPVRGGSIDELRPFVNVESDTDFRLVTSIIVMDMLGSGPFPVLQLSGQQGSAKSTTARVLRALVDPNVSPLRSEPREVRDLMIGAQNGHLLAFDNLSGIRPWLSDALCRLATGGGFSTRELYSDGDEVIFEAMRPVILTGIEEHASRGDLVDRSVIVPLPPIPERQRQDETTFWTKFVEAHPRILGALLDAAVIALRDRGSVVLDGLPRMADFARTAAAMAPAIGWTAEDFSRAYSANRETSKAATIESSLVGVAVVKFMDRRPAWTGSPAELLAALAQVAGEATAKSRDWPRSARGLVGELTRLTPDLTTVGITVTRGRRSKQGTPVTLEKVGEPPSPPTPATPATPARDSESEPGQPAGVGRVTVAPSGDGRPTPTVTESRDAPDSESPSGDGGDGGGGHPPITSVGDCEACGEGYPAGVRACPTCWEPVEFVEPTTMTRSREVRP